MMLPAMRIAPFLTSKHLYYLRLTVLSTASPFPAGHGVRGPSGASSSTATRRRSRTAHPDAAPAHIRRPVHSVHRVLAVAWEAQRGG